jgi:hypothetical protein
LRGEEATLQRAGARRQRDIQRRLANLEAQKRAVKWEMRSWGFFS